MARTTDRLYPLRFQPVFKERVWGGRRLARWFPDLPQAPIGEAWVLSDHPQGRTPVVNGPLVGETLSGLIRRFGADLVGTRGLEEARRAAAGEAAFPLLFKLLDCQENLSVQVHPADGDPGLAPGERGKTEMWVVLDAAPGSQVVYGLREGVTPADFATAVRHNRTLDVLQQVEGQPGDVLYVPAGTVHALGAGLLVAEIQQSSDTTYRVYDYDRLGLEGKPRPLHVEEALRVTRYGPPPAPTRPQLPAPQRWAELVRSPFFVTEQGIGSGEWPQTTSPESFQVILVVEGEGSIAWPGGEEPLPAGSAVLVPAALGTYALRGRFRALRVTIP